MSLFPKGSKLYSIFHSKCPRCHQGEVFQSRNPYNFKKMFAMHDTCSNCGLRYEFEPGVFYGAMYVSYGLAVALFVAVYIIMEWIYDPEIMDFIIALTILLVLGSPYFFRLSRMVWLNLFIKYAPEKRGPKMKG